VRHPIKGRNLAVDYRSYNALLTAMFERSGNAPRPSSTNAGGVFDESACAQTESARSSPPQ
jgi:hypothetical protein